MRKIKKLLSILLVLIFTMTLLPVTASAATLRNGSSGTEVRYLQMNLNGLGYGNLSVDSKYGAKTAESVKNFQKAYKLSVDGIAGNQTLSVINEIVKDLQLDLNYLKYSAGTADGVYGTNTKNAVLAFQRDYGLSQTGIADQNTLNKIYDAIYEPNCNGNHTKGSYLYYEAHHPHANAYKCAVCGETFKDGTYSNMPSCTICNPVKDCSNGHTKGSYLYYEAHHPHANAYKCAVCGETFKDGTYSNMPSCTTCNPVSTPKHTSGSTVTSGYTNTSSQILEFSKQRDGNTKITENFSVREFACKDGSDTVKIDAKLAALLQDIRTHFGKPVIINSAYRTTSHNKKVGGASNSYHLYGKAADIRISGVSPREIAKYAESLGVKGIGLYNGFVHVDTRTSKYFWKNGSGSVSTFR